MSDTVQIFDRAQIQHNRARSAVQPDSAFFLHDIALNIMLDRLSDVKRDFPQTIMVGAHKPLSAHPGIGQVSYMDICPAMLGRLGETVPRITGSEEYLPIAPGSADLIISNLTLHSVDDLPGALIQIRKALKPDGLFMAALFGGETLHQLRDVVTQVETTMRNGISPRIHPFADMPQMGGLLQRAGFSLPVVDSEIAHVTYANALRLMHDIRNMGEGNAIAARDKRYAGRDFFAHLATQYQALYPAGHDRIEASFEMIFLLGWSPHETQQKPLQRGSATHRLEDVLNSEPQT